MEWESLFNQFIKRIILLNKLVKQSLVTVYIIFMEICPDIRQSASFKLLITTGSIQNSSFNPIILACG